jgi:homoserine kinase
VSRVTADARRRVHVRVPATSANLGPGFDALGLALQRYDDVEVETTAGGITVEVAGEGAGEVPTDERHLVVRALRAGLDAFGVRPLGLRLRCTNRIPHARGLGSSAAAVVAGLVAARELAGRPAADLLGLATGFEGHPDNVAACLLGGATIAWTEGGTARAVRLEPHRNLRPVAYVPADRALTEQARKLLPADVPHADASRNAGRAALLVHALTADPAELLPATEDRLHQAYREPAMPESLALVDRLRREEIPAVLSGAGPTVLALLVGDAPIPPPPGGFSAWELPVDRAGAQVVGTDRP